MDSVELCAGAGGQALGLEQAGFRHARLVEIDAAACRTLRENRPEWQVQEGDLAQFDASALRGVALVAGGVPCPPFSKAGRQLGAADERDLFPAALRVVAEVRPEAVLIENVRGLLDPTFAEYRANIDRQLGQLGYRAGWRLFNAADFGVAQLRPRVALVALRPALAEHFSWPTLRTDLRCTVGDVLFDLMSARGWLGVDAWRLAASDIAPTLVGGSKKHGGPDLGPTRARAAWARLGVDGRGIADDAPDQNFSGSPRLTVRMCARLQGFPDSWQIVGGKTAAYRQVGNAFPPPVAKALGDSIRQAIEAARAGRRALFQLKAAE